MDSAVSTGWTVEFPVYVDMPEYMMDYVYENQWTRIRKYLNSVIGEHEWSINWKEGRDPQAKEHIDVRLVV